MYDQEKREHKHVTVGELIDILSTIDNDKEVWICDWTGRLPSPMPLVDIIEGIYDSQQDTVTEDDSAFTGLLDGEEELGMDNVPEEDPSKTKAAFLIPRP